MKKHLFTLTELLMAIGIIVILAAIAIPTTASAIKKAEKTKAQAQMTELSNALKNYEGTYGSLPIGKILKAIPGGSLQDGTLSADGALNATLYKTIYEELIKVLQGKNEVTVGTTNLKLNPRKTQFLEVQGNTEGEFLDPWGNPFYLVFDVTGDGKIDVTNCCPYGLQVTGGYLRTDLVIWSMGPDGKHNSTATHEDNLDNVYSIPVDYDKGGKYYVPSR